MEAITKVEAIQREEVVTPYQLLALAIETKADPDRLDKLMDLQMKWEANQARKAYVSAMALFRSKCPMIEKTRSVDFPGKTGGQVKYKYAGLSEIIEKIKGLMSECGLSHSWRTTQANGSVSVQCIVTHIDGHSEETSLMAQPDNTGSKNSIQAIASTVSYLERYTLFALLGLASQDMDNDGNNGKDKPKPQPKDDPETLVKKAFENYCIAHAGDIAEGFILDAGKFKANMREGYKQLQGISKKKLVYDAKTMETMAENFDITKLLTEMKR